MANREEVNKQILEVFFNHIAGEPKYSSLFPLSEDTTTLFSWLTGIDPVQLLEDKLLINRPKYLPDNDPLAGFFTETIHFTQEPYEI